jgi:hypothetical protein
MSLWCWVIFVAGMVLMLPALIFGPLGLVVEQVVTWAAFGYAMYLTMAVIRGGDKRLARNGVPGTAVVLSAKETNTVIQEGEFAWNAPVRVEVRPASDRPRLGSLRDDAVHMRQSLRGGDDSGASRQVQP